MSIHARDVASLDYMKLWDDGCVTTRLNELTQGFIAKLAHDDMEKMAMKVKRAFKPVPMFKLPEGKNIEEVYGKKARKLSEEVLEKERQIYVDSRAEKIKNMVIEIARKLRFMVWIVNEEGEPEKLKIIVERVVRPTDQGGVHDMQYVGDRNFERLRQINALKDRLEEFKDYAPYFSEELTKLYGESMGLATLQHTRKEAKTS